MKPTSKILVFLALLIFSAVMVGEDVNADNEVVLDNWKIRTYDSSSDGFIECLILEIDFTQGDSALVDIVISSDKLMDVWLLQKVGMIFYSQGSKPISMTVGDSTLSVERVPSYNKQFKMTSDEWYHGTYYFYIIASYQEDIYVDVDFSVLIDYDDDGLYGDEDVNPTTNDTWLKELEDRLNGINISLNYEWVMENITALSLDLDEFKSSIRDEVWNQAIDLSELRTAINETTIYLNQSLADLELETGMEFDVLHEYVVNIYNNLHILEAELGVQIEGINSEVSAIWLWNNESLNQTMIELIALDNREWANNAANVQEFQSARLELREAQEDILTAQDDIEDALDEAKAARTTGVVMGLVGIILAIVAIVLVVRIKSGDGT